MTKPKIDKFLIVDCEATCWEDQYLTKRDGELIQIAVVPIDLRKMEVRKDLSYVSYVKPLRTEVNNYCANLTGIKPEDVINADTIPIVFDKISKLYTKDSIWGSWGKFDERLLEKSSEIYGVDFPLPDNYYNLKNMFSLLNGMRKEMGLKKALLEENLSAVGFEHDAYWDALNTAKLTLKMLKRSIFFN